MSTPPFFLDVNIPMHAAGTDHPYKAPCVWIMQQVTEGRLPVAIDAEIIQEVLYRYGSLQRWDIAVKMAENLLELVPRVYPISLDDVRRAVDLYQKLAPDGVTARDVLHVAVMQSQGLTHIISTDTHFNRVEGLTRVDPQGLYQSRLATDDK